MRQLSVDSTAHSPVQLHSPPCSPSRRRNISSDSSGAASPLPGHSPLHVSKRKKSADSVGFYSPMHSPLVGGRQSAPTSHVQSPVFGVRKSATSLSAELKTQSPILGVRKSATSISADLTGVSTGFRESPSPRRSRDSVQKTCSSASSSPDDSHKQLSAAGSNKLSTSECQATTYGANSPTPRAAEEMDINAAEELRQYGSSSTMSLGSDVSPTTERKRANMLGKIRKFSVSTPFTFFENPVFFYLFIFDRS